MKVSHPPPSSKTIDLTVSQKFIIPNIDADTCKSESDTFDDDNDDDLNKGSACVTIAEVQQLLLVAADSLEAQDVNAEKLSVNEVD